MSAPIRYDVSLLTEHDIYLFKDGCHYRLHDKLGAHVIAHQGVSGTLFSAWAPNAHAVAVIGDFNEWNATSHALTQRRDSSGIWEGFVEGVGVGAMYKYRIQSPAGDIADRSDPFGYRTELAPGTASIVCDLAYDWRDSEWRAHRSQANALDAPWSIYEVHLGSWRRVPEEGMRPLTYRESALYLAEHMHHMGYTHVQLSSITEHLFAPTARYGAAQDLMFLIDHLHLHGIGVVFDWIGCHPAGVNPALQMFDGTPLFEEAGGGPTATPRPPGFGYNDARAELRAVLISSARFWLERYHADALRVPDVGLMVHADQAGPCDERMPAVQAEAANTRAIAFLRSLNEAVYREIPNVQMIAGECAACPMISRPTYLGGLGFGMAWNTRWAQDTLRYFARDPITRKYYQDELTFSIGYAATENFVLPLSPHEAVPGKGSLLSRLAGNPPQKFATLRLLLGYMYGHPGKKLLFMGNEFGTWTAWRDDESLPWHLLQAPEHQGVMRWTRDLNHLYRDERSMHDLDFSNDGFEWIDHHDTEASVISFVRKSKHYDETLLVVCNATPVARKGYRIGTPQGGFWREMLNSDAVIYGGSGMGNLGGVEAAPVGSHGRYHSLVLDLPPLAALFFKPIPSGVTG